MDFITRFYYFIRSIDYQKANEPNFIILCSLILYTVFMVGILDRLLFILSYMTKSVLVKIAITICTIVLLTPKVLGISATICNNLYSIFLSNVIVFCLITICYIITDYLIIKEHNFKQSSWLIPAVTFIFGIVSLFIGTIIFGI